MRTPDPSRVARRRLDAAAAAVLARSGALARVAAMGMTFVFSVVVARVLGADYAGVVFAAIVGVTLVSTLGRWGTDLAAMKRAPGLHASEALTPGALDWRRLARTCAAGSVLLTGLSLAAVWALRDDLAQAAALAVFALAIPLQAGSVLAGAVLRGAGRSATGALAEVGLAQGMAALATLALHVAGGASPLSVATAFTLSQAVVLGWALLALRGVWQPFRAGSVHPPARTSWGELGSMTSSAMLFYLLTWSPLLLVTVVGTTRDASLYGAAARFPAAVAVIPTIQLTATLPRLVADYSSGRIAEGNLKLQRMNRVALLMAALVSAPLVLAAPWVMSLFGPGFEEGADVLRLLALGQLVAVALGPTAILPLVTGLERRAQWWLVLACSLSVVLGAVLVATWGAAGAAAGWLAAVTGYGLVMAVALWRARGIITVVR